MALTLNIMLSHMHMFASRFPEVRRCHQPPVCCNLCCHMFFCSSTGFPKGVKISPGKRVNGRPQKRPFTRFTCFTRFFAKT